MAAKKKSTSKKESRKLSHPAVTEGRALQYRDLDAIGQKKAESSWNNMGNAKSKLMGAIKKETEAATKAEAKIAELQAAGIDPPDGKGVKNTLKAANTNKANLLSIRNNNLLDDVPTTLNGAAARRLELFDQGADRSRREGDLRSGAAPSERPIGAGWYVEHSRDVNDIADLYGFDRDTMYSASGAMSPQNSPDNEKIALAAIAAAQHANHRVTAKTLTGAKNMGLSVPKHITTDEAFQALPAEQRSRGFRDLTPRQIRRALGNGKQREHIDTKVNVEGLAKGGTGLTRGIGILRGDIPKDDFLASGPNGGPKVTSYVHNIRAAGKANANEVSEYYRRIHEATPGAKPYFEQDTLFGKAWEADPWGKANSTEGILDPNGPTAEDTWMRAISARQPKEFEAIPRNSSNDSARVGKFVGSTPIFQRMSAAGIHPTVQGHPNPNGDTIIHALNNEATIRAAGMASDRARQQGRNVGAGLPAVAMQEIPWTEYRIQAGKDLGYEAASKNLSPQFGPPKTRGVTPQRLFK